MTTSQVFNDQKSRIENYLKRLYGYAYGLTGNVADANDLVQECALKTLSAKREPDDENAYRAWLFRILKNAFIDAFRKRTPYLISLNDEHINQQVEFFDIDERFINVVTVRSALAKLPSMHHRIISLIDITGLSYAETAEKLDIPLGTVMSRISRARRTLIELIGDENVEPSTARRRRTEK
ncbi:MAG: RNA polymerase sigma factor [Rhodospirillales bacterium]